VEEALGRHPVCGTRHHVLLLFWACSDAYEEAAGHVLTHSRLPDIAKRHTWQSACPFACPVSFQLDVWITFAVKGPEQVSVHAGRGKELLAHCYTQHFWCHDRIVSEG
jgi:hypothetical protein